ncbi:MAG TPA: hypothetical protein VHT91_00810 [Kofleriaceae bacterium]|jgi:RES domain-containing protein|nr:hypothetical protein [Kofleriaceae bacterium]
MGNDLLCRESEDVSSAFGVAGAAGRDGAVQSQLNAAYEAGYGAPRVGVDTPMDLYRNVGNTDYLYSYQRPGTPIPGQRYNPPGEGSIYFSPDMASNVGEADAYGGMGGRTMVRSEFTAPLDPATGQGGIAEVASSLPFSADALTAPKGANGAHTPLLYKITGEDPYSMPEQVYRGAADQGASAMDVPSAAAPDSTQIDIIPRNTDPSQLTPLDQAAYDPAGNRGPTTPASSSIRPMAPDTAPAPEPGPAEMPAGEGGRAGSARYGAVGGGVMALGTDLWQHFVDGKDVSAGRMAGDTAMGAGMGALSGVAFDALAPALGGGMRGAVGGGGIIGGVLEGGMSMWNNAGAYERGEESAAQATANTVVDTGVGLAAGASGAALGAAIGSIIPGAGTAVGAALGFVGGMAGSYLVHALADDTGLTAGAKRGLGSALSGSEDTLGTAWHGIGTAEQAVTNTASSAWDWLTH